MWVFMLTWAELHSDADGDVLAISEWLKVKAASENIAEENRLPHERVTTAWVSAHLFLCLQHDKCW